MRKTKITKILLSCFLIIFSFILFKPVFATDTSYGLNSTVSVGGLKQAFSVNNVDSDPGKFVSTRVGVIVGAILAFIGVIFMLLIIYGGILWMTARGNEQQVEKAKSLIIQATIGLIIVLSAYAIVAFIGRQLTNTTGAPAPRSTQQ